MIDHGIFLEKWHTLSSEEEKDETMKNYMFSLSYEELTRFIFWGTDMKAFRAAQKRGEFTEEMRRELLKESDERIAARKKRKEQLAQSV
jgi:hypothetical protein